MNGTENKYPYIYESLEALTLLGEDTTLCIYRPTGQLYVVKKIDCGAEAFFRELLEVRSEHLANVLFVDASEHRVQILYEYISGKTLAQLLREQHTLPRNRIVRIIDDVCDGLEALHSRGLVHRDVNPNNIILTADGVAKIIDFGILRSYTRGKGADTMILGTPGYAAPEQFGFTQSDARTDIYAVGILLNVLCTGALPNEKQAGGTLGRIVRQCTSIDADRRYRTVKELRRALTGEAGGETKLDRFISRIPGLRSRNRGIVALAAILYLAELLVLIAQFAVVIEDWEKTAMYCISLIFSTGIPFFCFFNFLDIWDRIPFTKGSSRKSQRLVFSFLGLISLIIGVTVYGSIFATSRP